MKKLLTTLVLSASLFLVACGPSYDFSSPDALEKSVAAQAEKEGFSAEETESIMTKYMTKIGLENAGDLATALMGAKSEAEVAEITLDFSKKFINGKTLQQMKEYAEK